MKFELTPSSRPCRALQIVRLLIAAGMFAGGGSVGRAAGNEGGAYEVIANAFGFGIHIPGCADASKNIREIAIDELNIDVREMTTGLDVEYRAFRPGPAHFGHASFTVAEGSGKELQAWWQEAAKGKNIRKNITVTLFKSNKTAGRSYVLFDCFPVAYAASPGGATGAVATETLKVNIGRIEFTTITAPPRPGGGSGGNSRAEAASSDKFAQVRGFKVEISGSSGKEVDTAWESVSGGDMTIDLGPRPQPRGENDKFRTNSPGHKTVNEITLRGAMTDQRAVLCDWLNDTVNGKPWKKMLTITELLSVDGAVKLGKTYIYHDCFPIRYVFPRMSTSNTTGNTLEEVVFQTVREEPDLPRDPLGVIRIPDAPKASQNALAAVIDDMAMDINLVPKTRDARNHSARIVFPRGGSTELIDWIKKWNRGDRTKKTITLDIYDRWRATGRTIILHDCLPQGLITGNTMEEVSVKPIRVELK